MSAQIASSGFMRRGTWVRPNRPSARVSMASRRALLASQAELDAEVYDASLGSPLGSYSDATAALVGGKALQCWRLMRHGLPVPSSFVIPTYVYSMHIKRAGVVDLIDEVFSSNMADETIREEIEAKLAEIRDKISATPLDEEVVNNLKQYIDSLGPGVELAVRSSGSAEDLTAQSFAGQYDTFLYQRNIDEVCASVKGCWSSMFKPHILTYASNPLFLNAKNVKGSITSEQDVAYDPRVMQPPRMGVLVMKMIDAKVAGVCFTQNLWGDKSEVMIEAVRGQCEGLVSGEITPDRYVVSKISNSLCYQELHPSTHKYVRSSNMAGVEKVEIPLYEQKDTAILDAEDLKALITMAKATEEYYNRPQDIEWAMDQSGKLYLLQSRPITTTDQEGALSFLPPGEGFWTFDPTHFPRPFSPHFQDVYGSGAFEYAEPLSRACGSLFKGLSVRFVHGFGFQQPQFAPPSDALERAAQAYWNKSLYEDHYREFVDFFKPECLAMQKEMRDVNPSSLSHRGLVEYVAKCYDMAREFWKRHHTYSFPAMVVVGDFCNRMAALTGKDEMEALQLLEGASPESRGILNRDDPLLLEMYGLLEDNEEALALLDVPESQAEYALDCLTHMPGRLGEVFRQTVLDYGYRLSGGYDLVTASLIETPSFFLQTLKMGVEESPTEAMEAEHKVQALAEEWKSAVPEEKLAEFDECLDLGRCFFRLRDERGLCTDLSGVGLCRRGIMEAGRRLEEQGVVFKAAHLCVARKHEAIALLRGDLSLLTPEKGIEVGVRDVPTPRELQKRYDYIFAADPSAIPRALGTPPPEPDPMALPEGIRRTMGALNTGLLRGIWDEGTEHSKEDIKNDPDTVKGLAASSGITEGPACIITSEKDLQKVKKGDIIVAYSCSASINVVLGLCSGIVTDFGGMLSHAAIVAREYSLPAVVGSQMATQKFKDGDILRVDCSNGKVSVAKRASCVENNAKSASLACKRIAGDDGEGDVAVSSGMVGFLR